VVEPWFVERSSRGKDKRCTYRRARKLSCSVRRVQGPAVRMLAAVVLAAGSAHYIRDNGESNSRKRSSQRTRVFWRESRKPRKLANGPMTTRTGEDGHRSDLAANRSLSPPSAGHGRSPRAEGDVEVAKSTAATPGPLKKLTELKRRPQHLFAPNPAIPPASQTFVEGCHLSPERDGAPVHW